LPIQSKNMTRGVRTRTYVSALIDKSAGLAQAIAFCTGEHSARLTGCLLVPVTTMGTSDLSLKIGYQFAYVAADDDMEVTADDDAYATLTSVGADRNAPAAFGDFGADDLPAIHELDIEIPKYTAVTLTQGTSGTGTYYAILEYEIDEEVPHTQQLR
jgi:hypothetical protein